MAYGSSGLHGVTLKKNKGGDPFFLWFFATFVLMARFAGFLRTFFLSGLRPRRVPLQKVLGYQPTCIIGVFLAFVYRFRSLSSFG